MNFLISLLIWRIASNHTVHPHSEKPIQHQRLLLHRSPQKMCRQLSLDPRKGEMPQKIETATMGTRMKRKMSLYKQTRSVRDGIRMPSRYG